MEVSNNGDVNGWQKAGACAHAVLKGWGPVGERIFFQVCVACQGVAILMQHLKMALAALGFCFVRVNGLQVFLRLSNSFQEAVGREGGVSEGRSGEGKEEGCG